MENKSNNIAAEFIASNYAPVGNLDEKEFITSADIVRNLADMIETTVTEISNLMTSGGFKIEFIEGKPYWIVFQKFVK